MFHICFTAEPDFLSAAGPPRATQLRCEMPVTASFGGNSARGSPYESRAKTALFLSSVYSKGYDEALAEEVEQKGAKLGSGVSTNLLQEGFKEDVPLVRCVPMFGGIVTDEKLKLHHDKQNEWLKCWEHFATITRFGVLVLAGDVAKFQAWATSEEGKLEMQFVPKGRLFVYIEGVIVALVEEGEATVETGKGTVIFADGTTYTGDVEGGLRHGIGRTQLANGAVTTGQYVHGDLVRLIGGEGSVLSDRAMNQDLWDDKRLDALIAASAAADAVIDPQSDAAMGLAPLPPPSSLSPSTPRGPKSPTLSRQASTSDNSPNYA